MTKRDLFAICDFVAEAQAVLHDHIECGSGSSAEGWRICQAFSLKRRFCVRCTPLDDALIAAEIFSAMTLVGAATSSAACLPAGLQSEDKV